MVSMRGGANPVVNKEVKESREMSFGPKDANPAWQRCAELPSARIAQTVHQHHRAKATISETDADADAANNT
jgi:hypothetical protein